MTTPIYRQEGMWRCSACKSLRLSPWCQTCETKGFLEMHGLPTGAQPCPKCMSDEQVRKAETYAKQEASLMDLP
jgi:hypothetical protein